MICSKLAAIEAMKYGAFDYQLKPFNPSVKLATIERAIESSRLMKVPIGWGEESVPNDQHDLLVGRSDAMQKIFKEIGRVAATDATVLIRGESGTGKELVARAIYQHSQRGDQMLTIVNCAALPPNLIESELFGHERGAFTGAQSRRVGKFEQSSGGTLFLDEIGELPLDTQSKFLRVLQERTIERLGGDSSINVDVRIIAATNRDLEAAVQASEFREDLFHRLNVVEISLPPLRERFGDIARLVYYFAQRVAQDLGIHPPKISAEAMQVFVAYSWLGNVREVEHMIQRLVIMSGGQAIGAAEARRITSGSITSLSPTRPAQSSPTQESSLVWEAIIAEHLETYHGDTAFDDLVQKVEDALLRKAMQLTRNNQSAAARLLGLNRTTLQAKLKRTALDSQ